MKDAINLIHEINTTAENQTNDKVTKAAPTQEEILNGLRLYRELIILGLRFVKLFTGKKADVRIDEAIALLRIV